MSKGKKVKVQLKKTVKPIKPKSKFYRVMDYYFNTNIWL